MIYRELNLDINFFINDIDVFQEAQDEDANSFPCAPKEFLLKLNGSSFSGYGSKYSLYYQVIKSSFSKDDPDVNLIEYTSSLDKDEELHYFDFLGVFDFNCCAVGFDIESSQFYYHDAFLSFLKNKQLRVLSTFSPYHSFLRLFKKINDLGNIHCDIKNEIQILGKGSYCIYKSIVGSRFQELLKKTDTKYTKYITFRKHSENYDYVEFTEDLFTDFDTTPHHTLFNSAFPRFGYGFNFLQIIPLLLIKIATIAIFNIMIVVVIQGSNCLLF